MWQLVRIWVPIAVAVTGLSAMSYAIVQQDYRQSFNDPQIALAEDGAARLAAGSLPADVVPRAALIDSNASLSPWIAVFDGAGMALESSASMGTSSLSIPYGVLSAAKAGTGKGTNRPNENRVTWQNPAGVRHALVVVYVPSKDLYVASGRNMREVETRQWHLSIIVAVGWFFTLLAALIMTMLATRFAMYRND